MIPVRSPWPRFADLDGHPLDQGTVYFGVAGLDPESSPLTVHWDAAGTIPATQPVPVSNGYLYRRGYPGRLYTPGNYSMRVKNKSGETLYEALTAGVVFGADPFFEWNGTDTSQFGDPQPDAGVIMAPIVGTGGGRSRITVFVDTPGSGSAPTNSVFWPVNMTPPTANYALSASFSVISQYDDFATYGVMIRQQAFVGAGTGYATVTSKADGLTGSTILVSLVSPGLHSALHSYVVADSYALGAGPTSPRRGHQLSVSAEGQIISGSCGNDIKTVETFDNYQDAGAFGLLFGGVAAGAQTYAIEVSEIRAYALPNFAWML